MQPDQPNPHPSLSSGMYTYQGLLALDSLDGSASILIEALTAAGCGKCFGLCQGAVDQSVQWQGRDDAQAAAGKPDLLTDCMAVVRQAVDLHPTFVLDDPSVRQIPDIWLQAFEQVKITPFVVLMLRRPDETAAMLEGEGLALPGFGQIAWLGHVLNAEFISRGYRRAFFGAQEFKENGREIIKHIEGRLGVTWADKSQEVEAVIAAGFGNLVQRRRVVSIDGSANSQNETWAGRTYQIMRSWSERGENLADYQELDGMRQAFVKMRAAVAQLMQSDLARHSLADSAGAPPIQAAAEVSEPSAECLECRFLRERLQQEDTARRTAEALSAQHERRAAALHDEITRFLGSVAQERIRTAEAGSDVEWLRRMFQAAEHFPKWWAFLPRRWRLAREHRSYRRAGLFDAAKYSAANADVAAGGMDPVRHYIIHGMEEGRRRPQQPSAGSKL